MNGTPMGIMQNMRRGNFWSIQYALLVAILCGLVAATISACESQTQPEPTAKAQPEVSTNVQPYQTATVAPTLIPTATPTPLPTATATQTPAPTLTPTPAVVRPQVDPPISADELNTQFEGNIEFAFDLYRALVDHAENIFFSPYSVSSAFAMAYAGARGETERQMAETLRYNLPQNRLRPVFNELEFLLASRGKDEDDFRLLNANAVWIQKDHPLRGEYLDLVRGIYGSGVRLTDFRDAPEDARADINHWTSEQTEQQINDLIPKGAIKTNTRLILTNAIYFKADWENAFSAANPIMQPFFMLDGSELDVAMMFQETRFDYAEGNGYQAVKLPYIGDELSMIVIVPDKGNFKEFESLVEAENISNIISSMRNRDVILTMPKFRSQFNLTQSLFNIGLTDAFNSDSADFSGMDGNSCPPQEDPCLLISGVLHEAFVLVDEQGTEAAAATAVFGNNMNESAIEPLPPIRLTIDRPFIFLIRDRETGTILFMGRIENMEGLTPQ